ncbi:MAG: hypothetical protein ACI4KA_07110 [Oscillospiraceae bacterium]
MKRLSAAAAVMAAALIVGAAAQAYTNYCDGATVASVGSDYSAQLKDIGTQFDSCLAEIIANENKPAEENQASEESQAPAENESAEQDKVTEDAGATAEAEQPAADIELLKELYTQRIDIYDEYTTELTTAEYDIAIKLIDYDLLLKKLKLLYEDYKNLKQQEAESAALFRLGECSLSDVEANSKARESKYYDIQALLYEILALKTEIEAVTGTNLTSDLDYEQAYLITDVVKLDPETLMFICGGTSLCIPEGIEQKEFEAPDITAQYNTALQCYYALGTAMREYVTAANNVKKCEAELKLGAADAEQLKSCNDEKAVAYMNACTAKAELAKALIDLDRTGLGVLTNTMGISGERAMAYKSAVSPAQSGSGLWLMGRTANGVVFMPTLLPYGVDPDEEDTVTFTVKYNGKKIGSGSGFCLIPPQEYTDECRYADVTYYINGAKVGTYKVDVFSPYGEFIG